MLLIPFHQSHCSDMYTPRTPWDAGLKSSHFQKVQEVEIHWFSWISFKSKIYSSLEFFFIFFLNHRGEDFDMQEERFLICKRISLAVSLLTFRNRPSINFYWLQQKLRTSGPCTISLYCSIHMVCYCCLVMFFLLLKKRGGLLKIIIVFQCVEENNGLVFKKHAAEACELKIFLLPSPMAL